MRIRMQFAATTMALLVLQGASARRSVSAEAPDLRGVWRSVSYVRDGRKMDLDAMMIITARHISRVSMERNRPSFAAFDFRQVDKLTPDQQRAIARAYPMFNAMAGTWRIDGDTLYFRSTVHHNPDAVGRESDRKLELQGERLRLYGPAGSGVLEELWERIELAK